MSAHRAPSHRSLEETLAARGEDSAWFRRLPPAQQDEFRRRWAEEKVRAGNRDVKRRVSIWRMMARALVVFAVCHGLGALLGVGGAWSFAAACAGGVAVGVAWSLADAGPYTAMMMALPVSFGITVAFVPSLAGIFYAILGGLVVGPGSYVATLSRDLRRSDGTEA
ncbi:MAG: hypothetical protein HMLKMBBP_00240 [Planctomycetes bacterium]|nr:hypothetical protein [Planctomycetota bacterium]